MNIINNNQIPLLTIAIPTWNRAKILELALSKLLPQIRERKDYIEFIISDNHSTDETHNVILNYQNKYNDLNFVHFTQPENTGYYGNFRKCRELSKGKWFWLLSDNDYINDDLVSFLITSIEESNDCSVIFLQDWIVPKDNVVYKGNYKSSIVSRQELVEKAGYKLTLTSGVLFINNKQYDQDIFENFKGNTFLGFTLFLSSMKFTTNAIIIEGPSLLIATAKISFNVFTSFAIDLVQSVNYARTKGFIDSPFETTLMTSVILNNTKNHYITYKIKKVIYSRDCGNIKEIEKLLVEGFGKYEVFKKHLYPLFVKPRNVLIIEVYLRKLLRKFKLI